MAAVADQVVVDVLARTDQAKRDVVAYSETFDRSMKRTVDSANRAENAVVRSGQQQRAAYQQLGFQLSDVVAQASSGTSAFVILAQQGGQTAAALSGFGGVVGRVATFMSGPFGAAILGAVTVMGLLATRSDEGAAAHRKQGEAAKTLKEAIEDLDAASGIAAKTEEGRKRAALATARALLEQELRTRDLTKAELERQIALLGAASIGATSGEPGAEGISAVLPQQEARVVALQRLLDAQNDKIRNASARIELSEGYFRAARAAEAATSASAALEQQLDRERDAALARYQTTRDEKALQAELTRIEQRRIDASKADADARRAATAARKAERDAIREATAAEREFWSLLKKANDAMDAAEKAGQSLFEQRIKDFEALEARMGPSLEQVAKELNDAADRSFGERAASMTDSIQTAAAAAYDLRRDLAAGMADAALGADSLGDALENAFKRAAIAAIEARIFDFLSSGKIGGFLKSAGNFISNRPPVHRASGGHVSAGQLYRINEGAGRRVEGFVPASSGKVIPLGAMQAAQPRLVGAGAQTVRVISDVRVEPSPLFVSTVETRTQQVSAETTGRAFRDAYRPRLGRSPGAS